MTKQEWVKVPGLPEHYEINRDGQLRILPYEVEYRRIRKDGGVKVVTRTEPGKIVKQYLGQGRRSKGKYPIVSLKGHSETRLNLLVARAFHGCPYDSDDLQGKQRWRVRHKDGNTLNVHADNLEWIGNVGNFNANLKAAQHKALSDWDKAKEEPIEDWLLKFYSPEEIDWSTAEPVMAA